MRRGRGTRPSLHPARARLCWEICSCHAVLLVASCRCAMLQEQGNRRARASEQGERTSSVVVRWPGQARTRVHGRHERQRYSSRAGWTLQPHGHPRRYIVALKATRGCKRRETDGKEGKGNAFPCPSTLYVLEHLCVRFGTVGHICLKPSRARDESLCPK